MERLRNSIDAQRAKWAWLFALGRIVAGMFMWPVLAAIALGLSLAWHVQSPLARRIAAERTSTLVTGLIVGELRIGRFDSLSLDSAVARHVQLFDAGGTRVVSADRVTIALDLPALLMRTVHIPHALLDGGTVRLIEGESGLPTLIESFAPLDTTESVGPTIHARIDVLQLRHVTLYGELLGLQGIRAVDVSIDGQLTATPGVNVAVTRTSARLVAPFPFEASVDQLTAQISELGTETLALQAQVSRGGEHIAANVRLTTPDDTSDSIIRVHVHADPMRAQTLAEMGFAWAAPLTTVVTGDFSLSGPVNDLTMNADLRSAAGPVTVRGVISTERGVSVTVSGQSLPLRKLIEDAPDLRVSGLLRVDLPVDSTDASIHVELEPLLWDTIAIPAFALDGVLLADGVRIDRVRALHIPGALSGSGTVGWDGRVQANVRAQIPDIGADANVRRFVPGASGSLQAEVAVLVDPEHARRIDLRGRLRLGNVRYGPLTADSMELSGYARGDRSLPRVDLRAKGQAVRLEGYLLGNADLAVKGGPPEYRATGEFQRDGQRAFHVDAVVAANRQEVVINADQLELAVGEETWRGAIQQLKIATGESVSIEMFRLASRAQRLEAQGIIRFKGDDSIDAQLQGFDVTALRAILGDRIPLTAGYLDTNLQLRGDLSRPQVLAQGAITAAAFKAIENINGLYFLTYDNGALQLDTEIEIGAAGTWSATAQGTLDPTISNPVEALRAGYYDLAVTTRDAQVPAIVDLLGTESPLSAGTLEGTVSARGNLYAPAFESQLTVRGVQSAHTTAVDATIALTFDQSTIATTTTVTDAHGDVFELRGSVPLNWSDLVARPEAVTAALPQAAWRLDLSLPQRAISQLPLVNPPADLPPLSVGGRLTADRLHGRLAADGALTLGWLGTLPPSSCASTPVPTGSISVNVSGPTITLLTHAGFNHRALVRAQGTFQWPLATWIDGGALPLPTDLTGFVRMETGALERIPYVCDHGRGRLYWTTEFTHLWTDNPRVTSELRGEAHITAERQRRRRKVLVESCPEGPLSMRADMTIDSAWASASADVRGCGGGVLEVTGRSPLSWMARGLLPDWDEDRALELQAVLSEVQLKPLLDRIPGVFSAAAVASGRVTLAGTPRKPTFDGSIAVRDGSIRLTSTGQNLTDVQGEFILHRNWIQVRDLHTRDEAGTAHASGGVGFDGWTPSRLRVAITTRDFPVRREGTELAAVTSESLLQATIAPEAIGVDLAFASLGVRLPDDSGRAIQSLDTHPDIETVGRTRPPLLSTGREIGIHVTSARPFWVRRSDFSALVDADLRVLYSDPDFAVGGYVEFNRGVFDVFGKSFNLERGSIRFDGGTSINPELNLIAVHDPQTVGGSPVRVVVTGRLDAPQVTFYAQGCEDESGALSLLLTGRCTLARSTGPDANPDTQRAAFVTGLLAGVLTLGAKRELGGLIPVIGIEGTGQGFNQRIRAGIDADTLVPQFLRPIVRRAYVEGAVTTGSENQDGVSGPASMDFLLELYFPHNLVGTGRMAPGSNQVQWGVDVTWEPY